MAISLNAPNPDNYVVGNGRIFMKLATDPDWVRVGNVTECEFTPTLEELEHFDRQQGTKTVDKTVIISRKAEWRMVMEEWTPRNLALMLMGPAVIVGNHASIDIFSTNVTRCAIKYEGTNDIGPKWSFEFPGVDFKPSSSLSPISDEWAPLEITGSVARVDGSFGTADADFVDVVLVNTVLPQIGGTAQVGQTLTAFPGVWTGSTPTYSYQWQKANVDIVGATDETYVPVVGDIAATLTVVVTATNGLGSVVAESPATAAVIAA